MYIIIIFIKRWRCPRPWWFMRTIFNKMIRAITIKTTLIIRRRFWSSRTVFNKMIMTATGITAFGTISVSVIPRAETLTRGVFGRVMTMTWRMRRSPWLAVLMPPVPIVLRFRTLWVATSRIMIRRFKNTTRSMVIRRVSVIFIIVMRLAAGKVLISVKCGLVRTVRQRLSPSGFDFLFHTRPRALWQQTPPEPVLIP